MSSDGSLILDGSMNFLGRSFGAKTLISVLRVSHKFITFASRVPSFARVMV